MTRINAGIPVSELSDKHLIAEHREIKRVCHLLENRIARNNFDGIPGNFHEVKNDRIVFRTLFWLDKGKYTYNRYLEIRDRCRDKGFKVTDFGDNWEVYLKKLDFFNDYEPTDEQVQMIRDRIADRSKPLIQL